jgi:hypothetical protein
LLVALIFYTALNSIQVSASNYLYKDITTKINTNFSDTSAVNVSAREMSIPSSICSNNIIDDSWSKLLYNIFKSKSSIDKLNTIENYNNSEQVLNSALSNIDLLLFTIPKNTEVINSSQIGDYSYLYNKLYTDASSKVSQSKYYNVNTSIDKLGNKDLYTNSIKESMNLANQTRWSFKMSPISDKLSKDNYNYTQAKQLLGSNISNSANTSNNVWASSSLSKIKDFSSTSLARNVSLLNFFEDSRL